MNLQTPAQAQPGRAFLHAILSIMNATKSPYLIPAAIILAGAVLSVATYMIRVNASAAQAPRGDLSLLVPVGEGDRILGKPDAEVMIVEYSDIDCEYCERSREAMQQVMADYGTDGRVAWTFRHFPVIDLYPDSGTHAEAAECAALLGGEGAFWRFLDALAAQAPGASRFDPAGYPEVAELLGIPPAAFSSCVSEGRFEAKVRRDFENGLAIGADVAPFLVVIAEGAAPIAVSGYLPYEQLKAVVERALSSTVILPAE